MNDILGFITPNFLPVMIMAAVSIFLVLILMALITGKCETSIQIRQKFRLFEFVV